MRGSPNLSGMVRVQDRPPRLVRLCSPPGLPACWILCQVPPPLTPHVCLAQITDILVVNHRKLWKSNILTAKLYCDPCTLLD